MEQLSPSKLDKINNNYSADDDRYATIKSVPDSIAEKHGHKKHHHHHHHIKLWHLLAIASLLGVVVWFSKFSPNR